MLSKKDIFSKQSFFYVLLAIIGTIIVFSLYKSLCNHQKLLDVTINETDLPNREKAMRTKEFVEIAVAQSSQGISNDKLDQMRNNNEYLIGYNNKGRLLVHGRSTDIFCDREFPTCNAKGHKLIGKDLYNFKTLGGIYEVRLWLEIAKNGGGWASAYWKNNVGEFEPKYYYIKNVPNKDLILASGYFA